MLAAVALSASGLVAAGGLVGDHRHRLAAERIVDEDRPAYDQQAEQPQHAGQQCGAETGSFGQPFALVLAERGAQIVRFHGLDPRESSAEFSTRRIFPVTPSAKNERGGP